MVGETCAYQGHQVPVEAFMCAGGKDRCIELWMGSIHTRAAAVGEGLVQPRAVDLKYQQQGAVGGVCGGLGIQKRCGGQVGGVLI